MSYIPANRTVQEIVPLSPGIRHKTKTTVWCFDWKALHLHLLVTLKDTALVRRYLA
jgi:hypothetical protein